MKITSLELVPLSQAKLFGQLVGHLRPRKLPRPVSCVHFSALGKLDRGLRAHVMRADAPP